MIDASGKPATVIPAYRDVAREALWRKAEEAVSQLADCRLCPRDCGVNRLQGKWSACRTGRHAVVSSAFPHFGEEDCLRGWNGSGTIFFGHCNLRCQFCQNWEISWGLRPGTAAEGSPPEEIAAMMLGLQARGCHNINLVTPEHVVPEVLEALVLAIDGGLDLPIVYNTSAYDSMSSLEQMEGIVDIYMPDFKYWSRSKSRQYLKAADYPDIARATIREMFRQVGPLVIDADGPAIRGVLLRHLVMPGGIEETRNILEWVAEELGRQTYVNLMDQYRPQGNVGVQKFPELNRTLRSSEWLEAVDIATDLGLRLDQRTAG